MNVTLQESVISQNSLFNSQATHSSFNWHQDTSNSSLQVTNLSNQSEALKVKDNNRKHLKTDYIKQIMSKQQSTKMFVSFFQWTEQFIDKLRPRY